MTAAIDGGDADQLSRVQRARRDLVVAAVLVVMSVVLLITAQAIPDSDYEPMGPRFLADLVPGLILFLALLLALRSVLMLRRAVPDASAPTGPSQRRFVRPLIVLMLLLVYCGFLHLAVSYVLATAVFICAAAAVLAPRLHAREMLRIGIVSVAVACVINLVFEDVLSVLLP